MADGETCPYCNGTNTEEHDEHYSGDIYNGWERESTHSCIDCGCEWILTERREREIHITKEVIDR